MALLESVRRLLRGPSAPGTSDSISWQACAHPRPMLEYLRGKASDRKLRLFGVACCRRIWHRLPQGPDEFNHYAVEVAERFADGRASRQELDQATPLFTQYCIRNEPLEGNHAFQTWQVILPDAYAAATLAAWAAACAVEDEAGERKAQAVLLRDIFGNPFRPVAFSDSWRTDTAMTLARQMYESRDFSVLPILADALQDAGCNNEDILNHCRDTNQVHVRGCWVVDLVLDKK